MKKPKPTTVAEAPKATLQMAVEQPSTTGQVIHLPPATITPMEMISRALTTGASVETLKSLMDLQERYDANEARKAFDIALAAAKREIRPVIKNRAVDFENKRNDGKTFYEYEDLAGISEAIDEILGNNGLSYTWSTAQEGNVVKVTCILRHERGHREETTLGCPVDTSGNKNHIQAIGSVTTYLERYTLKAAVGVASAHPGYDNDGNSEGATSAARNAPTRQEQVNQESAKAKSEVGVDQDEKILAKNTKEQHWKLREELEACKTREAVIAFCNRADIKLRVAALYPKFAKDFGEYARRRANNPAAEPEHPTEGVEQAVFRDRSGPHIDPETGKPRMIQEENGEREATAEDFDSSLPPRKDEPLEGEVLPPEHKSIVTTDPTTKKATVDWDQWLIELETHFAKCKTKEELDKEEAGWFAPLKEQASTTYFQNAVAILNKHNVRVTTYRPK